MKKYFRSTDEQIEILRKRGLRIEDEELAKKSLLRYNYYKLVNSTLKYFKEDTEELKYREGTNFQDLLDVHNFENNLKRILLSFTLEIERIARSIISYKFVEKYPKDDAYLDFRNFDKSEKEQVLTNIESIKETIIKFEIEDNFNRSMYYYKEKYGTVPFWFVVNFISFGKLANIYDTLDIRLREDIADEFQIFLEENLGRKIESKLTPRHFSSYLKNAREIRNIGAHDNLILDKKFGMNQYMKELFGDNTDKKIDSLFDAIITFKALLPKIEYDNMMSQINIELSKLKNIVDKIAYSKIIEEMGVSKYREA